jgi:DNA repair protein RecN (Recombination protein N)
MLQSLYIRNYALIDTLDISFSDGFSVITGETGAGKSIILGAISLLLGARADSRVLRDGADRCIVEARFCLEHCHMEDFFAENDLEYDDAECILRREVYATGKSRAFINDTPAQLAQMKALGEKLIDVHSQHRNLLLNHEEFQLSVVDLIAGDEPTLEAYRQAYTAYHRACREYDQLVATVEANRKDEDFLRFQLDQLDQANLRSDEQKSLEQEAETLSHAEEIKTALFRLTDILDGNDERCLLSALKECEHLIASTASLYAPAGEWRERITASYIELKDLAHEIAGAAESVDVDPARLTQVSERLDLIYNLQRKHRVETEEELLAIADDLRQRLDAISSSDDRLQELDHRRSELFIELRKNGIRLSDLRKGVVADIERRMQELLIPLGIPNVKFRVDLSMRETPSPLGLDEIHFLFSANKNGTLQDITQVASGGEIARVMLSLKALIAGAVKLPTIIFDEIDTGVSGPIAEKMAMIMEDMGRQHRQVISITHLPQIAARGKAHYKVYKEDTADHTLSHIRLLTYDERVSEIANMLSGAVLTEAALNNARALLDAHNPDKPVAGNPKQNT